MNDKKRLILTLVLSLAIALVLTSIVHYNTYEETPCRWWKEGKNLHLDGESAQQVEDALSLGGGNIEDTWEENEVSYAFLVNVFVFCFAALLLAFYFGSDYILNKKK